MIRTKQSPKPLAIDEPRPAITQHLYRSSLLVLVILGLNKVTGFVKLQLATRIFGINPAADALAAANQLPELLQAMLAGGALGAALIPVYSAYLTSTKPENARLLANTIFTLSTVVSAIFCGAAAYFAPWLTRVLLVPDFSPEQQMLTADLMRITLIATMLLGVASILSGLLHAHKHFFAPALGTVLIDLGQVAGLYFLAPTWGIHGAAWGSILGTFLLTVVQFPALWRLGVTLRFQWALRLAGVREVIYLMGPRIVTLGASQATDLVIIRLASGLPDGSIAAYFYALLLMVAMPSSLFAAAIGTVFFPTMAEQFNQGNIAGLRATTGQALRTVWALIVPTAIGLIALGRPAIAFLFQRGSFDANATALVYSLAVILAIRVISDVTHSSLTLPFFARHNTRTPMWISLGWMVLTLGLSLSLIGPLGVQGLAWAAALAALAQAGAIYYLNGRLLGGVDDRENVRAAIRILFASACMGGVIISVQQLGLSTVPYVCVAITLGSVVYLLLYTLTGGRELRPLLSILWPTRGR